MKNQNMIRRIFGQRNPSQTPEKSRKRSNTMDVNSKDTAIVITDPKAQLTK